MAEEFIINSTEAAYNAQGESNNPAARTAAESAGAPSDAELRAIADTNGIAVMQTGPTAAEKLAVAQVLCISAGVLPPDLVQGATNTANLRQKIKIRAGQQEMLTLWNAIVGA